MRHRATPVVRVPGECARCGSTPREIMREVAVTLRTVDGAARPHELRVCRSCDARPTTPTHLERAAAGFDPTDPIRSIEFFTWYKKDLARVHRTAAYFLGAEVWAELVATQRAQRAAAEAQEEQWDAERRARLTEADFLGTRAAGACAPADDIDDEMF